MNASLAALEPGLQAGGQVPLVSIVIPTYRRPTLLAEAIASALGQDSADDYEVLVLDNDAEATAPFSAEVVAASFQDPRLRYVRNAKNLGMTGNWNRGLEVARGTWMTLLHDDDLLYPGFLEGVLPLFDRSDLITCRVAVGSSPPSVGAARSNHRKAQAHRLHESDLAFSNVSPAPGIIFRRAAALHLGGFREAWYPCADYDFWIRYVTHCRAWSVPEILAFYRIQDNESLQTTTRIQMAEKAALLQKDLVERLMPRTPWRHFVAAAGVQSLLQHYCKDPLFRDSEELAVFSKQVGFRPGSPRWWIKFRLSLAKRLLRWTPRGVVS